MQTFLPYSDFTESSRVLDRQRLGKQRVEAWQILGALTGPPGAGWSRHPAVLMWRGYEAALLAYGEAVCREWISRGYRDTMLDRFRSHPLRARDPENPWWLGSENFHLSHRSNLLRKFPEHYRCYWKNDPDNLPYVWPVP